MQAKQLGDLFGYLSTTLGSNPQAITELDLEGRYGNATSHHARDLAKLIIEATTELQKANAKVKELGLL